MSDSLYKRRRDAGLCAKCGKPAVPSLLLPAVARKRSLETGIPVARFLHMPTCVACDTKKEERQRQRERTRDRERKRWANMTAEERERRRKRKCRANMTAEDRDRERTRDRERKREQRQKRKKLGICVRCWRDAAPDRTLCEAHLAEDRERRRATVEYRGAA